MDKKDFAELKKKELGPLYFECGAGLMDSQTLEYDIRFLIFILNDLELAEFGNLKVDNIGEGKTKHTIGILLKILRSKIEIEDAETQVIGDGVEARNNLIHHYLMNNIERLSLPGGKDQMILEVRELRKSIQRADKVIKRFVEELIPAYGLSVAEYVDKAKDDFLSTVQFADK